MPPVNADDRNRGIDAPEAFPRRATELTAIVTQYDLRPDECTLHPRGATDEELMTKWISAEAGSFVALEEMR